uniref:Uncharacterized protein n=1 Tax=Oryza glaberrima TaxID=4538 RepID=I1NYU1_ORYGL
MVAESTREVAFVVSVVNGKADLGGGEGARWWRRSSVALVRELGTGDRAGETPPGPAVTAPACLPLVPAVVRCGGDEDETM